MNRITVLHRRQTLPAPAEEVFAFYADARNLEAITPPWLAFRVITPEPIRMAAGTLIEYRLRLHRVPIRWRTQIVDWEPPRRFVDVQLSGPFERWEHTHTFEPDGVSAVTIGDTVRYAMPLGPLGTIAHALVVRRDLERIFDFRQRAVVAQLGSKASPGCGP